MAAKPSKHSRMLCVASLAVTAALAVLASGCSTSDDGEDGASRAVPGQESAGVDSIEATPTPPSALDVVVDEAEGPAVVMFEPDDGLSIPVVTEPIRGALEERCPEPIWHDELGTFAVQIESTAGIGEPSPTSPGLYCFHRANGVGGSLQSSWAPLLPLWKPMVRTDIAQLTMCPPFACDLMPNEMPEFIEFGQTEVSFGEGGRLSAAIYDRTPEQAEIMDTTPGRRGFVLLEFELGEVLCRGSWAGPLPSGGLPLAAVELAVDSVNQVCGATAEATSVGAPATPTTLVAPTFTGVPPDFGRVPYESANEMPLEEAQYWARAYLGLLAEADYAAAATLLGVPVWPEEGRSRELRPLGIETVTADLDDRLRAWCATDGICLPALDPYPNVLFTDVDCTEVPGAEPMCFGFREAWLDPNGNWRVGFTLAAPDGTALRVVPDGARPENLVISVGVTKGRVWVRGLPPSRTFGDPASRLPQLTVTDAAAPSTFELPGRNTRVEISTDDGELCISIVVTQDGGGSGSTWLCSGDPAPLSGMMDLGISGRFGPRGPESLTASVVAADVMVEAHDPDGEPRQLVARLEAPQVTNGAMWIFAGPFDRDRWDEYRTTFTLPDGTTVTN